MGRPSIYSLELVAAICEQLAEGNSLRTVLNSRPDFPSMATVFRWLADPTKDEFAKMYETAKGECVDAMFEEIVAIADNSSGDFIETKEGDKTVRTPVRNMIDRDRLRIDARKFYISKVKPKKYGERLELGGGGADGAIRIELVNF